MRVTTCKFCPARIMWIETVDGRRMPLDVAPNPAGRVILEVARAAGESYGARRARVLLRDEEPPLGALRYMPHHATCKNPPRRGSVSGCSTSARVSGAEARCGSQRRRTSSFPRPRVADSGAGRRRTWG